MCVCEPDTVQASGSLSGPGFSMRDQAKARVFVGRIARVGTKIDSRAGDCVCRVERAASKGERAEGRRAKRGGKSGRKSEEVNKGSGV